MAATATPSLAQAASSTLITNHSNHTATTTSNINNISNTNNSVHTARSHSSSQLARKIRHDLKNPSSLVKGILGLSISLTSTSHPTTITYEDVTLCSTSRYVLS